MTGNEKSIDTIKGRLISELPPKETLDGSEKFVIEDADGNKSVTASVLTGKSDRILVDITEEEYGIVQAGLATIIEKAASDTLNSNDIKPMFDIFSKGLYFQVENTNMIVFAAQTTGGIGSRATFSMIYDDKLYNIKLYLFGDVDENGVKVNLRQISYIDIPSSTPSNYFINIGGFTGFNQEKAKSLQEVINNLVTKEELGTINTILDNINGEVI